MLPDNHILVESPRDARGMRFEVIDAFAYDSSDNAPRRIAYRDDPDARKLTSWEQSFYQAVDVLVDLELRVHAFVGRIVRSIPWRERTQSDRSLTLRFRGIESVSRVDQVERMRQKSLLHTDS